MIDKIKCNNPREVLNSIVMFNYILFSGKNSDEILFGQYLGISTNEGVSTLAWSDMESDDNMGRPINIDNGLVIFKVWEEEPSDTEILIAKNDIG